MMFGCVLLLLAEASEIGGSVAVDSAVDSAVGSAVGSGDVGSAISGSGGCCDDWDSEASPVGVVTSPVSTAKVLTPRAKVTAPPASTVKELTFS